MDVSDAAGVHFMQGFQKIEIELVKGGQFCRLVKDVCSISDDSTEVA